MAFSYSNIKNMTVSSNKKYPKCNLNDIKTCKKSFNVEKQNIGNKSQVTI